MEVWEHRTHQKAETRMLTLRYDMGALVVAPQEESRGSKMDPGKYRPSADRNSVPISCF